MRRDGAAEQEKHMHKLSKLSLLIAVIGVFGALASSASATTWTSNGSMAFTGTTGASRLLIKNGSGTVTSTLNCTTTSGIGTLNVSASFPNNAATMTPRFSTCSVAGQTFTVACNTDLAGGSSTNLKALGWLSGVTSGSLTGVTCNVKIGPTVCTTITGSVEGTYTNPDLVTPASGFLTIFVARQQLAMTTSACVAITTGTPSFGAPSGTGIADLVVPATSPSAPGAQPRVTGV
jgi:hypothetical protein